MVDSKHPLPTYDNPPEAERVRALICSDGRGQVQVVAPEAALVEPETWNTVTSRVLRSVPPAEQQPVCAIPGFYGLPSVVHKDLKNLNQMALATEMPGRYVRATGAEVNELCNNHVSFEAEFSSSLKSTPAITTDDEQDILSAVDEFTTRRIQARLDETLHIPPLPEAARRIIELQQDPNFDLLDLVKVVETDPAISARIMGWANSALYGAPTPAKTLNDAIMRVLGFDTVFNMALGMAIGNTLNLPDSHVTGANSFWLDAVYTAAATEALAHQVEGEGPSPGTCYLAGLLANFGTLVVGHVFPPQYETICRIQDANPHLHHSHVDQHVLSVNREVIASTLLESWEVPDEVTTAIRFQHVPNYTGEHESIVNILALAQTILTSALVEEYSGLDLADEWTSAAASMHIPEQGLRQVVDTIHQSKQELGELAQLMMH